VALGEISADLALTGGRVLNVYTGEILADQVILIAGEYIAYVGPAGNHPAAAETVELAGRLVVPGFIEGHTHDDIFLTIPEYVRWSLPRGTTTVVTECSQTANAAGLAGVQEFLAQFRDQPQRYWATCPMIAFLCGRRDGGQRSITAAEMLTLLDRPEMLGLGETYWSRLLGPESGEAFTLIEEALARGKTVEGHSAGARRERLAAFAAAGVDACHEPITADEVRDRLRLGLYTMIREGSVRRELDTVLPALLPMGLDLRRTLLVSDGVWPGEGGHLDSIVQKAVDLGLDPVRAIQMVTLNAAEHFHLAGQLGAIAPGKAADLVVLPGPRVIRAETVICRGRVVAREGRLLQEPTPVSFSPAMRQTIRLGGVEPGFFRVTAPAGQVRAMEMVSTIVTREAILTVQDGEIRADVGEDILKVACLDRHSVTARGFTGFYRGYGLRRGAVAASWGFDAGNPLVIGADDADMAGAVNRLIELGGGLVLVVGGQVVCELPTPLFGTLADLPAAEVASRLAGLDGELRALGCRSANPLLTLLTVSFTAIPALRVLAEGYWLAKENALGGLLV